MYLQSANEHLEQLHRIAFQFERNSQIRDHHWNQITELQQKRIFFQHIVIGISFLAIATSLLWIFIPSHQTALITISLLFLFTPPSVYALYTERLTRNLVQLQRELKRSGSIH